MREETEAAIEKTKEVLQDIVVVVSLVRTLTESFGSANDLYRRLKRKNRPKDGDDGDEPTFHILPHNPLKRPLEKRHNLEKHIRWGSDVKRGDDSDKEEELISTSSNQVRVEYDRGYRKLGEPFARGDPITHIQLQHQIILLQRTLISIQEDLLLSTYLAPSSSHSHLVNLIQTIRATRTGSIHALTSQYERMLHPVFPEKPILIPGAFPLPSIEIPDSCEKPHKHVPVIKRGRRRRRRISSSSSSSSNEEEKSKPVTTLPAPDLPRQSRELFCIYARDLQKDSTFPIASGFRDGGNNICPFCRSRVGVRPGKAWEIIADSSERKYDHHHLNHHHHHLGKPLTRTLLVRNRFVLKSHRPGEGFACLICAKCKGADTVCREIAEYMDHLWREHTSEELEKDEDIVPC